jgi:uncharacterized damage-inducible protein DinB
MNGVLEEMYSHLTWANARVLEALRATPDPEALRLFAHVLAAEEVWLARIEQRPARHAVWPSLSADDCATLAEDNDRSFHALLARGVGLDELEVRYTNSAGYSFHNSATEILTHVALHGHYHRGQIAQRLRGSGVTPPYTDFIGFARRAQEGGTEDAGRARR